MQTLVKHISKILDKTITNKELIYQAFMHTSYVNEHRKMNLESNERLEFLGDAVLELIVSDYLYQTYPSEPEGNLSRLRAQLVREATLALLARKFKFNEYIQLGKGEKSSGGSNRDSILADCFEAFLGAIYMDLGMEVAKEFLEKEMLTQHQQLLKKVNQDFKTLFQEFIQQEGPVNIEYRQLSTTGPAHNQIFEMGLFLNGKRISVGQGKSKKQAESLAAKIAYEHYYGDDI